MPDNIAKRLWALMQRKETFNGAWANRQLCRALYVGKVCYDQKRQAVSDRYRRNSEAARAYLVDTYGTDRPVFFG